ncbi:MAG: sigma-70 family RNA polymerase sigma factor [Capsulimonadales bacterium]|nr:sigma-70 family RNA polymerase sigma factor [Capsulimonadales bacterium]
MPGINLLRTTASLLPMGGEAAIKTALTMPTASTSDSGSVRTAGRADAYEANSDAALALQAAEGDMEAFRVLVERYKRPMAALVSRIAGNPDDVDDIVQELFLRAWKGLPRFRGDAQFSTWLYRIAVNTAIKHRSRHRNETSLSLSTEEMSGGLERLYVPEEATPHQGGDPFRAAHRKERERAVRDAVQSLPEKQRAVVVLHYFEGHSCEEISKIVGCSLGTVWSRLHYACKRLKSVLESSDGSEGIL